MKKYFIAISLLLLFNTLPFAQISNVDRIVQRKVDSLEDRLTTVKGNTRVDYLNNIAHGFYWLWDDDTYLLDSACKYANLAFNEAKRLKYKRGLGYAYLQMQHCEAGRAWDDSSRGPNSHYAVSQEYSKLAIQIGEEIVDNLLIGSSYENLGWFENFKGNRKKYEEYAKKALEYYDKPLKPQPKGAHVQLTFTDCESCGTNDYILGNLNLEISNFEPVLATKIALLEKAIGYYIKSNDLSYASFIYITLGDALTSTIDIDKGISAYKKAISLAQALHYDPNVFYGYIQICEAYYLLGDFENGISYSKKSVELAETFINPKGDTYSKDHMLYKAYSLVGKFYSIANDFETAFAFMKKARLYVSKNWMPKWSHDYGEIHRMNNNYDSAMYYITNKNSLLMSRVLLSMKQFDKVLELTDSWKTTDNLSNKVAWLGKAYSYSAVALYGKNEYNKALTDARIAFNLSKQSKRNLDLIDNCQLLSNIFSKLGINDSAYIYLKEYVNMRDSLLNRQFYIRLNDYKKEAEDAKRIGQINLLQKNNILKEKELLEQILLKEKNDAQLTLLSNNNKIKDQQLLLKDQNLKEQNFLKEKQQTQLTLLDQENKLKDQRLKQQAFIRNALLGGLLLFILLGGFVFRNLSLKRKNENLVIKKSQAEFQQKVAELEMQALRAQMNPHFIFNCLNSINRFIFKNETREASDYLTRFSRLIRMVLLHSQKKLVPLEDELEMLKLYLDMERLRFKNAFDYHITTTNAIENSSVFIPPLLLQPFCENAIWHGLMHKEGPGHLNIELNEDDGILNCIISDDGVGREKAEAYKSKSAEKEKSMGLKITKERLSLLNQGSTGGTFYEIEDVRNEQGDIAGTRVELKIRYKETVEEYV